ncbi:hypothetical protein QYF61_008195 [Mycteria americana]|uniref:Uncharacterized protein n=1 Tax=Mycteria americana TaxID=33587 RepID=A0AAN7RS63_MYCAM|nr:hypothetical protein QYF61_008195 [Mycteria americana]
MFNKPLRRMSEPGSGECFGFWGLGFCFLTKAINGRGGCNGLAKLVKSGRLDPTALEIGGSCDPYHHLLGRGDVVVLSRKDWSSLVVPSSCEAEMPQTQPCQQGGGQGPCLPTSGWWQGERVPQRVPHRVPQATSAVLSRVFSYRSPHPKTAGGFSLSPDSLTLWRLRFQQIFHGIELRFIPAEGRELGCIFAMWPGRARGSGVAARPVKGTACARVVGTSELPTAIAPRTVASGHRPGWAMGDSLGKAAVCLRCLAPLMGDSGISILAWSRGQESPIPHVPLVLQPLGSAASTKAADAVVPQVEVPFDLAEEPVLIRLLRAPSNLTSNVSRDGASTTSLGNLFQCLTTLMVKNLFLKSSLNLPSLSLKPLLLVLSQQALPKILEGCSKVSPQPSLLQAEQPQLSQPVLVGEVLQPLDHFHGPPLDLLQQLHVLLVLRAPELDAVLQVRSHQSRVEGQNHLPRPAGHASFDAAQDTVGLLGCERTLLAHVQLFVHQYPQVLFRRAALNHIIPQPELKPRIAPTQV